MTTAEVLSNLKFDVTKVRKDFPILSEKVYGKPLIYFDNAATSQKPKQVIDALVNYYSSYNANIHRGVHFLSQKASQAYDDVRKKVQDFIVAESEEEVVFTRGTTESINLVASSWGRKNLNEGDEVIITAMEHHSNIVPWQLICEERKAVLKVIPMNDNGELLLEEFKKLLTAKTKMVAVVHTSNSLGTVNPVNEIIEIVRSKSNSLVLVDAAQAVVHEKINVQEFDCDFLAFSSHKMLGPTGVGVLYGKQKLLEEMSPYQGGGDMIKSVSFSKTTYNDIPFKFEAGTPNVADVIAFGAAIDYLNSIDRNAALQHELNLAKYAEQKLLEIDGVKLIGTAKNKTSVVAFIIDGVNTLDAGMYLDTLGIAVRTGHHCTEPVMERFKISGTIRASFLFYNTIEEVDALVEGIKKAIKLLKK
ncbi:MAG TPA: SufS family cysteine desulfurase [Bacteroidia bacterium]|nr:SufS family cysteine desulfurase [Bacteroidia bacterium]HNU32249.1 SufS family cysteine desulfurase [Bacteroidia bacterium]